MSVIKLNRKNLNVFLDALEKLTPDSPRKWGKLDATRMLIHVHGGLKVSLEEKSCGDFSNIITRRKLFHLIIFRLMPWPKGKIKAPPEFTPDPEDGFDFETEKKDFANSMLRCVEVLEKEPSRKSRNPILGVIDFRTWSMSHGKHMTHHFEQFGLM